MKPSDDMYDNYYKIIGELHLEPRARPSDRMKTPEEIALEEKEALEKKEKERLKRMHASDDDDDDEDSDDTEGQSKHLSKIDRYISGDDLGDSFSTVKDAENGRGWVDDIYEREKNDDNHKEDGSSAEDSESVEDDQEGSDDSDGENGDVADGIEYDKISSMKDWEKSDVDNDDDISDEIATQNLDENGIIKMNLDSKGSESTDQYQVGFTEKPTLAKEEILYVIQAPKTLSEMCSLLDNHSDIEVVEIIRRIRAYNSINLGTENRRKMQVFYGVLLSYFASLATQKPLNVKIINSLVQPLIEMGTEVPYFASVCARERLVQTRKQLCEDVKIPGKSSWPSLKTINLLRLWSLTFPCSDFRHVVITPAILLICEYLTRCPITSGRDIAVGSLLCSMALSVAKQSLKYFPEVLSFLQTVLKSCMEKNSTHEYTAQSHMESNVSQPWLLIHDEDCNVHPIDVFMVLEMDADSSYFNSDNFKASILSIEIKILKEFASIYERLSSFPEIFLPIAALLHEVLHGAKIPCVLQGDINDAVGLIRKKISEHHALRQPLQMRKQKPEPLKLLNPKFEENFVKGIDYDPDRERAQRKKLKKLLKKESKGAVRELRKDNHFIFKLKERDRLLQEEERAEKYGKALAFLQEQEHAFKSGQLGKGRKKRK
ncbi:hypothetical protein HPP92_011911 [Vanilla planifolia]|uniref:Nucleolar protein 14 n=1 Tax=Vanilla planifolia TaxID=51239 RepID=A0A835RCJ7_VANPL|nr:hypothetical protein HPP92_011911 [Vanilla planifolia]